MYLNRLMIKGLPYGKLEYIFLSKQMILKCGILLLMVHLFELFFDDKVVNKPDFLGPKSIEAKSKSILKPIN